MVEFRVLGPLQALDDGRPLLLGAPKQRAVLAALLLARGAVVGRDELADAVWGEAVPGSALSSLQVYVHGLRRALGGELIETHGTGYRLETEPETLDLDRFERLLARGRHALSAADPAGADEELAAALALWQGRALADLSEQPIAVRAAWLEERRLEAVELRNDAQLALGRHESLLATLEPLIREHPYRERLREQQILALYRAGRQKDALDAYRDARGVLAEELGVEPGPALRELERAVLRHDPGLDAAPRQRTRATRLPAPPTPLVGRRLETAAVAALLRRGDVRLVTLTGAGGIGKTRLALAAAAELAPELPDGAVFVDLAPVREPALVAGAVAQALGAASGEDAFESLVETLRERSPLLLLDNLEQLLPDVPLVSELLAAVPRLRILATSRAPLRLSGEHEYPVPALASPPPGAGFEEAAASDAVRLFSARVQAVDHGFALADANVEAVAAICRRLDGLPLALELAAAQARLLEPGEIERRLEGALELLVEGARDLPPRQRTLRATLDWSHELLEPAEQRALARLAVFAGGCSLAAAQAVAGGEELLGSLATLVANGLLRRVEGGSEPRFALLETIRVYALERLRREDDEEACRRRHAEHFLAVALAAVPQLIGPVSTEVLAELDRDYENLVAAIGWASDAGEVETEVRLVAALRSYWAVRGNLGEARRFFERAIAHGERADPALHGLALVHGAVFAFRRGDLDTARREWETALAIFRELGNDAEVARCTGELGAVALAGGELDLAERLWREAAESFAADGNRLREALVVANLAAVAAERGEYEKAAAEAGRALALQRELGDDEGIAVSAHNLARYRLVLGDPEGAAQLVDDVLVRGLALGYRELLGYALGIAGELAVHRGRHEAAARLLGSSDALFADTGVARLGEDDDGYRFAQDAIVEQLGADAADAAGAAGAALPLGAAVAEAREAIAPPAES